jgi:large subunit ribosomal protein L15
MAMRIKRRRKSSRFRGSMTHKRGFKKKARGSGHRGGFGMAGTGKRAKQKKTLVLNLFGNDYFGKDKCLRRGHAPWRPEAITLDYINENVNSMIANGLGKDLKGSYELNLENYKIIGNSDVMHKLKIKARSASPSAIAKIQEAKGTIELVAKKEDKKEEPKKAVKAEVKAEVKPAKK